ncbi:MAG: hypothetical protein JXJ18_06890 [Rhodobacteraceae bacterium]|nr:hypothetical protein [Paracoccaceae bacterium]
MKSTGALWIAALAMSLAGCEGYNGDKTVDRGFDAKDLSQLKAGIWVDPNGCDHWIIDDGVEGYLSQRLDRNGKPVCSGVAPPNTVVGPFKSGSTVADVI